MMMPLLQYGIDYRLQADQGAYFQEEQGLRLRILEKWQARVVVGSWANMNLGYRSGPKLFNCEGRKTECSASGLGSRGVASSGRQPVTLTYNTNSL
jgi:hypothetical protein